MSQLILFAIVVCFSMSINAQTTTTFAGNFPGFSISSSSGGKESANNMVIGDKFMYENWQNGSIISDTDSKIEGLMNFDAYAQDLRMIVNGDTLCYDEPLKLKMATIGKKKYIYAFISNENGEWVDGQYVEVVVNEGFALLCNNKKIVRETGSSPRVMSGKMQTSWFTVKKTYYLRMKDKIAVEVDFRKRKFVNQFPNHKSKMKEYLNENYGRKIKPEQLSEIIKYYNSLK